ncbi:hypothetical protein [Enterobacter hormaechei]|uniref:hypothetical protein n=1 Tax=Enterobacter hormaechei TaxID=158836 RepID=UPI003CC7055E
MHFLYLKIIFMKEFHLLLFYGSSIFPECILIFGLFLLLVIDVIFDRSLGCEVEAASICYPTLPMLIQQ